MTVVSPFRVYDDSEVGPDGYPPQWHSLDISKPSTAPGIKHLVREKAGNRCLRCGHPYEPGMGEWSPCDERCTHGDPRRISRPILAMNPGETYVAHARRVDEGSVAEAQWRILTVHHLNGVKFDCRWWNLVSLCQRCHLRIQRKVILERVWPWEHSEWFKPYAAAWYAWSYLSEDLTIEETLARLDDLLALERVA